MASRTERVLVTGAGGFTGRHLCALLRESGCRVFGLVETPTGAADEIAANLHDPAAVAAAVGEAAPDQVVHLAAIAFPGHARADEIYRTNLSGTLTLLEALVARRAGGNGVVLASTGTVYGAVEASALDEDAPTAPATHYAVSKLAMEQMARLFGSALPITIVRPFNCTGPGQREPYLVPKLVRHFAQRAGSIDLGNIDVVRDFIDVRSAADAYRRLLKAPDVGGKTFNLCSGVGVSVRELVAMLERITGHAVDVRIDPRFVRAGEPGRIVGSPARLHAAAGVPTPIDLSTTLVDMLGESAAELAGAAALRR